MQDQSAVAASVTGEPQWDDATAWVHENHRFAVIGHITPDADDVGSMCAMIAGLHQLGKEAVGLIGQSLPLDDSLLTIPGAEDILVTDELPPCDAIIVVDCGSSARMGALEEAVMRRGGGGVGLGGGGGGAGAACGGAGTCGYRGGYPHLWK
jgi:hypothetical protein